MNSVGPPKVWLGAIKYLGVKMEIELRRDFKTISIGGSELIPAKHTLNSKVIYICLDKRPCKRIRTCNSCRLKRRYFFVQSGCDFSKKYNLDSFITVSFLSLNDRGDWAEFLELARSLSKKSTSSHKMKYIRTLGMGSRLCAHIHYLTTMAGAQKIKLLARSKSFKRSSSVNICIKKADDLGGLLGYFYDQNFIPAFCDPLRPKGIRILSASKGMPCGFPSLKNKRKYPITQEIFRNSEEIQNVY